LAGAADYVGALAAYNSAAKIDDQYADLDFRRARCYAALGDLKTAQDLYLRARDLDTLRFRADSQINEIIRRVATASRTGVQLLDAQALFSVQSREGIIGSELLYDHVHFTPLANYLFARAVFKEIMNIWPGADRGAARNTEPPSEAECERLLALTDYDRVRLAREMLDRLQRPPFTSQLTHLEQVRRLMLEASAPTGGVQDAVAEYRWAIAQHPDDLMLHYKFGSFLFNFDRAGATQEFILARPNDEFPVTLPDGTRIL
jgi:tetratricopeptide (TPR) repeat protein